MMYGVVLNHRSTSHREFINSKLSGVSFGDMERPYSDRNFRLVDLLRYEVTLPVNGY